MFSFVFFNFVCIDKLINITIEMFAIGIKYNDNYYRYQHSLFHRPLFSMSYLWELTDVSRSWAAKSTKLEALKTWCCRRKLKSAGVIRKINLNYSLRGNINWGIKNCSIPAHTFVTCFFTVWIRCEKNSIIHKYWVMKELQIHYDRNCTCDYFLVESRSSATNAVKRNLWGLRKTFSDF